MRSWLSSVCRRGGGRLREEHDALDSELGHAHAGRADGVVAGRPGAAHVASPHAERREQRGRARPAPAPTSSRCRTRAISPPRLLPDRSPCSRVKRALRKARADDLVHAGLRPAAGDAAVLARAHDGRGSRCRIGRRPAASTRPSSATTVRASCTIRSSTATRSARSSDRRRSSAARESASTTASPTCGTSSRSRSRPASSRSRSRGFIPMAPAPS